MKHDIEKYLRLFESKDGLKKDKVSRATDGQELGQPLNNPKEDGLENTDLSTPPFCREPRRSQKTETDLPTLSGEHFFLNGSEKRQWRIGPSLQPVP